MSDSDSDSENNVHFGTPLAPYEEDEIPSKRKYQDPSDQVAVDSSGKRRFHGAFTGGFTAGYGNTVATPEGFTPAQFKSSRNEKAESKAWRPEDFMDEEDRGEFGIAPKRIETQSDFAENVRRGVKRIHSGGVIPGDPILEDILKPVRVTAAIKMLKAMGVKLAKKQLEASSTDKVYGCFIPPEFRQEQADNPDSDTEEIDLDSIYSDESVRNSIRLNKSDRFGIDYEGLSRRSILGNTNTMSHLKMVDKGKKVSIHGQAFGVGALEEDDDDIYATHDLSQYDFALGPSTEKSQTAKQVDKDCLVGFIRAKRPPLNFNKFPIPNVPRDYVPKRVKSSRFAPSSEGNVRDRALGRHDLTPETRGVILGEKSHTKIYKESSIKTMDATIGKTVGVNPDSTNTSNLSPEDRIANIVGRNVNFVSTDSGSTENEPLEHNQSIDEKEFKPFASNPAKQKRYEAFLKDRHRYKNEFSESNETDNLCAWERARESKEFEQAAKLYRPLDGVMSQRFTHGSQSDDINPLKMVEKSKSYSSNADSVMAASKGLYGQLTRTVTDWIPTHIVCKRFNVPNPSGAVYTEETQQKSKLNFSIFEHLEDSIHDRESYARDQLGFSGSRTMAGPAKMTLPPPKRIEEDSTMPNKRLTVAELFLAEREKELAAKSETQPESLNKDEDIVNETIDKFDKMDLYKAIFLSDSDHSDSDIEKPEVLIEIPKNVERNDSPPRGIFANIDFDALNSWPKNKSDDKVLEGKVGEKSSGVAEKVNTPEIDTYGPCLPALPPTFNKNFKDKTNNRDNADKIEVSSSSSDDWVESNKIREKKSKKKKSKHKKSKKKHKHKNK